MGNYAGLWVFIGVICLLLSIGMYRLGCEVKVNESRKEIVYDTFYVYKIDSIVVYKVK